MDGKTADSEPPGTRGRSDVSGPSQAVIALAAFDLSDSTGRLNRPVLDELNRNARAAIAVALGDRSTHPAHSVRVRIVADAEMAALHLKYSKIPGTTDVLTFDLAEGAAADGEPLDVDIVVCLDEADRQAAARGHGPELELLLYILHGVLHCLGEDDHDDAAFAAMHAREDAILTTIGLTALFARPAATDQERA